MRGGRRGANPEDPTEKQAAQLERIGWARRCRVPAFVALSRTIVGHRPAIETTFEHGLSNGVVESTSTTLRASTRLAFGFHPATPLVPLAMLTLGGFCPPSPGRGSRRRFTHQSGEPRVRRATGGGRWGTPPLRRRSATAPGPGIRHPRVPGRARRTAVPHRSRRHVGRGSRGARPRRCDAGPGGNGGRTVGARRADADSAVVRRRGRPPRRAGGPTARDQNPFPRGPARPTTGLGTAWP
ncbi:transposase [Kineococcus halophytocola]|uniref:transposase n=1 Tax=Kineococcus halophytocola TaxID=3234027 RepID=UPI003519E2BC